MTDAVRRVYTSGRSRATSSSDTLLTHAKASHEQSFTLDIEYSWRQLFTFFCAFGFLLFCGICFFCSASEQACIFVWALESMFSGQWCPAPSSQARYLDHCFMVAILLVYYLITTVTVSIILHWETGSASFATIWCSQYLTEWYNGPAMDNGHEKWHDYDDYQNLILCTFYEHSTLLTG